MQYYDPERDNPVDGLLYTSELFILLRDLLRRGNDSAALGLSPEAVSGLCELFIQMHQCLCDIQQQLYGHDSAEDGGC